MTLNIELPNNLEAALKVQARAKGISEAVFVRQVLERLLIPALEEKPGPPFETGYGMWAKYGPAPPG